MGRFPIQADLNRRSDADHEAKCRRCGISCHLALPVGGSTAMMVVPELHCRFLARMDDGWGCTVYDERFERAPWCHHADDAAPIGLLARDCPHVVEAGIKRGKVVLREPLLSQYWPRMMAAIAQLGVPIHIDRDAFVAEVTRREGRPHELVAWPGDPERLRLVPVEAP